MSQQPQQRFRATTHPCLSSPVQSREFDTLGQSLDWLLQTVKVDGIILERRPYNEWHPRYAIKAGTIISTRGDEPLKGGGGPACSCPCAACIDNECESGCSDGECVEQDCRDPRCHIRRREARELGVRGLGVSLTLSARG